MLRLFLGDVGPNLGALNRAVLVASDFVVVPLGADLFLRFKGCETSDLRCEVGEMDGRIDIIVILSLTYPCQAA